MKAFDVVVWVLIIIGALNWGLVGLFDFNLVSFIFGQMTVLARIIYTIVGLAALYDVLAVKAIFKRWHVSFHEPSPA
ncbi:MAG: DUF378 domain-containing protein [Phycisphaerae bacterium]|nr:DUF378 domain-containing protein [Phycisphaerae bacterium]